MLILQELHGGVRGAKIDPDGIDNNGDEFYAPAPITVARYTRHVNNEELTDYFVRAVAALSTDYTDVSQSQIDAYKNVQKMYLGTAGFNDSAWLPSWLAKTATINVTIAGEAKAMSPKDAKAMLDQIAIDTEAGCIKAKTIC